MIFQCFMHTGTLLELRKKAGLVLQSGQWLMSLTNFLRLIGANFSSSTSGAEGFTSTTVSDGSYTLTPSGKHFTFEQLAIEEFFVRWTHVFMTNKNRGFVLIFVGKSFNTNARTLHQKLIIKR
jgi:hypothetical protein